MSLLQSGDLWNAYETLLGDLRETVLDLEAIRLAATREPAQNVSRRAMIAKQQLEVAVTRAKAITHPARV